MNGFKKAAALLLAGVLAAGTLTACGGSGASTANNTALKIGAIGPITGSTAVYGIAVQRGAEIAVEEINAKGGLQFDLNYQDDEGNAEKAVNAYNTLKDWGMQVLMGTVTSDPCKAVAAKTKDDNMFQLTPSGTAVECVQYDNAFRMCFSDPSQGQVSAQYIAQNKLANKVAVIYDSSDVYSTGIYEKFQEEAQKQNLEIVAAEAFTGDAKTDFTTQIKKAQTSGADMIFLPIYYQEASLILQQASKNGVKTKFFGCDGLDGLLAVENFDTKLAEGVMLLTPFATNSKDEKVQSFVKKYQEKYGELPNQFAADAYDAIYTIYEAANQANVTPTMGISDICEALKPMMTQIKIDGVTGNQISWDASGEPTKAPKVLVIKNGEYQEMK